MKKRKVTKKGNTLFLRPKTPGLPTYEVRLDGKLPERIAIKQDGLVIVVEYQKIGVKT